MDREREKRERNEERAFSWKDIKDIQQPIQIVKHTRVYVCELHAVSNLQLHENTMHHPLEDCMLAPAGRRSALAAHLARGCESHKPAVP
eukprot:834542-Pleurochrysis_carterae.AAC.1